ncbi:hypothetical protein [Nisaea sp.]|uniref:hypothetical protein n=1 Tax=Nisaea sp. TaxID=2024842 RepID=UPI00326374A9
MKNSLIHTPTENEIIAGIIAGKQERSIAVMSMLSGLWGAVISHFEWRADINRTAISARCPDCSC